jgi:hypothetical protein
VKKYVASKRRGSAINAVIAATTFQKTGEVGLLKQIGMIKGKGGLRGIYVENCTLVIAY